MAILAGDIVKTTMSFGLADGTVCQNIFHHQRIGVGVFTDQAIVTAIEEWSEAMYAEIQPVVKDNVIALLCSVDRVEWVVDEWKITENIGVFTPDFTPEVLTDALPNMDSAFVVLKTARPKTIGRKFLPPFGESMQAGSYLIPAAVEDVVAWADDAVNDITLQVLDYMRPGVPRTGVDAWYPFTVGIVTNLLGTQRRRRPGVGS